MGSRPLKIASFIFVCILLTISKNNAQDIDHERHIEVSLRMIAHQVLLSSGDSTSRVLPIIKEDDRYRIQFESEFEFMPEELVSTIDRVVKETKFANHYIVEVEKCETLEMVYSFEMYETELSNIIPCKKRNQPKSCYSLLFTLTETGWTASSGLSNTSNAETNQLVYIIIIVLIVVITVAFFVMRKRNRKSTIDTNMIPLGE